MKRITPISMSTPRGIVCCQNLRGDYTTPVICNPATSEFLTLPAVKSNFNRPKIYFGYDPTHKKFKVLSITANGKTSQARVLTLEAGELLWRRIECKYHDPIFAQCYMICIDGVLYYLARISMEHVIVCFDVKSEKFSFISIDDKCMTFGSTLINYKGRLGMVQFADYTERSLRLWLLEEDAEAGINKWSSIIHELPLSGASIYQQYQIVGMTRTCDVVLCTWMFSTTSYGLLYYNVERKSLARTEVQGLECYGPRVCIFKDYVEDVKLMRSL